MEEQPEQHGVRWIVYHIICWPKRLRKMIEQGVQAHGWQMLEPVIQRGSSTFVPAQVHPT